ALLKKSLERYTAGTLERYLAASKQFIDFLGLSHRTLTDIDVAFLADFLHACENSLEEDREVCKIGQRPTLKALSWLGRNAYVSVLQPILQASLIKAFLTQPTSDRKEALPLPLAVVVEWERYICTPHCPQDLRLLLGGLLLALHGGVRFGDLQRIRLNSLSLTSSSLRGVCWQTKTAKRGQPFAVTLHGLSGRSVESLWDLPFLQAVQSAWSATEKALGAPVVPDFILPVLTNLGGLSRPASTYAKPMSYSQSLAAMRHFLTIPWQDATKPTPVTAEESRAFTLHSLKARQHQGLEASQAYSQGGTTPVSTFGEGVSRFGNPKEADLESFPPADPPEPPPLEPELGLPPKPTPPPIPEYDTEALLVEKFANQAHSSSESENEQEEAQTMELSTFSLFRNGPWGVIHACREREERAACGASKTSAAFAPSSDPSMELEKFCKDHGVHEVLAQALTLKGLETVDDFAYAFPELRSLDSLLSGLSESDLSDMGSTDQFHGIHAARLRKALRFAHDRSQQPAELVADFKTNYPGELLDDELLAADRKIWGTIGKGGKQGKGLANKAKSEDWPSNWVYKAHGKVLCKRYQRNLCTEDRQSQAPQPEHEVQSHSPNKTVVASQSQQDPPRVPRLQERFEPLQVLLLDTSGDLGISCLSTRLCLSHVPQSAPGGSGAGFHQNAYVAMPRLGLRAFCHPPPAHLRRRRSTQLSRP
ncbi:unnamed protein product, partial [Symbiodinium necroappetens]